LPPAKTGTAIVVKTPTISRMHSARNLNVSLRNSALSIWLRPYWRDKLNHPKPKLTAEEIEVRIWGFVVVAVTMILFVIVIALLYSVTFVTQPIKSMAPIDMAYTKMLNDIVLLVVGGIGGVMSKRVVSAAAHALVGPAPVVTPPPAAVSPTGPVIGGLAPVVNSFGAQPLGQSMNWMNYQNPALDETWTPPPPPTTPPELQEPDHEREHMALARKEAE